MPNSRYRIPLRPAAPGVDSAHEPNAEIRVDYDADTDALTVQPLGCAVPLRNLDDLDRYVDALVVTVARIHADRNANRPRYVSTTSAECKQGCGRLVHVAVGFEKWAECDRCAGLDGGRDE
ncbi:hypothetical protein SEA_ASHERTHEMAN_76 [Gordonia phage Ashertheman]|uniref:Uncharacterized protein n=3 Tax=Kroosvirus TaxID=2948789 RepID=A0A515ML37_9CAUD|nr:hypothetical protein J1761_gp76 [Gordonia phage Kroos]YP_010001869.1 hypothetical protein J1764_gp76 [Gordonia phage Ashertheman]YP_010002126.1 hypothetical protein J1767_gp77 [Gordonia phage Tangerine]WMI33084.1 hypothetical protein SEA_SCHOTTB_74 [Gordonia Phage SchottB]AXQ62983.1 hypothetical protein SEA_ASHERTHEMAN_76 [Gordonia phage Ashertheman]AYR03055.1 hypothetical protein SEA_KROOS_76 [Gordonia phage Kroos]QDM57376.1 hypothetical protein SEA_TANGERINE_77 [Gordonia phage Tangerine]